MPARPRTQAGFTMLEVVLAMTLLAMVTSMIYAAFHLGVRSVEKGQAAVVSAQRARAASDVMRRQLKSMFPYPCRIEDDEDPVPFFSLRENPPVLEFVTAAGLHGGGGLEYVRYEVRGNPPELALTASPVFWFDEGKCGSVRTVGETQAVLLDGFTSLDFEPRVYEEGDSWKAGEGVVEFGLPRSVRVRIEGLAGSAPTGEDAGWTVPIVANLESEDGWRVFSQFFEEGEEITVPGDAPRDDAGEKVDDGGEGGEDEEPDEADEADVGGDE
jgi:general secretion pathway protein J